MLDKVAALLGTVTTTVTRAKAAYLLLMAARALYALVGIALSAWDDITTHPDVVAFLDTVGVPVDDDDGPEAANDKPPGDSTP